MVKLKYGQSYRSIVKSNQLDIDSEIAEIRYKIRATMQHLGEEGDMLNDLRDKINYCLKHETDDTHESNYSELFDASATLTRDTSRRIGELQELLAEYHRLMDLKIKSIDNMTRDPSKAKK